MADACTVCGSPEVRARDRCAACYAYRRRHHRDRPEALRVRSAERELERELSDPFFIQQRARAIAERPELAGGGPSQWVN